jgi:hypothetical protein
LTPPEASATACGVRLKTIGPINAVPLDVIPLPFQSQMLLAVSWIFIMKQAFTSNLEVIRL